MREKSQRGEKQFASQALSWRSWCRLAGCLLSLAVAAGAPGRQAHAQDELRHNSGQPYLSPQETVRRFVVPDGFQVKLFAAEPDLANPIAMCFDERGRLWVVECFEYPKGAPPGQKPRDRIKVFEDTDGDHRADKISVFADGFNLATGIAVGHGGVFLGVAPDLLFIPIDKTGDKPAGPPEKLLTGFGRHDTHELLNTFTWGPDGWLYGLHGVFTHSKVQRAAGGESTSPPGNAAGPAIEMNAAVWRYHPRRRAFEIFAEGTSNPWGIDFDDRGNMFLTCCVIPHLFHMIPGGRYIRQAGQNRNPYDFGQLKEVSDHLHHSESGWAHAGCVVLEGELWPQEFRGSVIFGSIHGNSIKRDVLERRGSTFVASHAADFLKSGDKNFRPVHQEIGPDGAVYVIDWHDQWPCHQTPPDAWEKERGRVYKIVRKSAAPPRPRDLSKLSNEELLAELGSANPYVHRTARRLLDERQAKSVAAKLSDILLAAGGEVPQELELRALWTLFSVGGFDDDVAGRLLEHPSAAVRAWTVRLLGEQAQLSSGLATKLVEMAGSEPSADVRLQLAATCQRLDAGTAVSVIEALAVRDDDARDQAIPLMLWFAYEPHVSRRRDQTLAWLETSAAEHAVVASELVPRVTRRLAATGRAEDLNACVRFAAATPSADVRRAAVVGLAAALEGRRVKAPPGWVEIARMLKKDGDPKTRSAVLQLGANFQDPQTIREAEALAINSKVPVAERIEAVRSIAVARRPDSLRSLETLLGSAAPELQMEVLRALAAFENPHVPQAVLGRWKSLPERVRGEAVTLLVGRREWAAELLDAIEAARVDRADVSAAAAQRIISLGDERLADRLAKTWGTVRAQTPQEIESLLGRMRRVVAAGRGSAEIGRTVFEQKCATCHKFEGKGADVGPDISGADRSVEYLLINILDPNRVVGQPYYTHVVATKSGRVVTGKLVSDTPDAITVQGENNKLDVIPRDEIEEHAIKNVSVMPEGLPKDMTEEQFRDLIEFLRRK